MKSFSQFIEDIQASVASNASVEDMETGELLGVGNEYPRHKKKKLPEETEIERLSLEEFLAEEYT